MYRSHPYRSHPYRSHPCRWRPRSTPAAWSCGLIFGLGLCLFFAWATATVAQEPEAGSTGDSTTVLENVDPTASAVGEERVVEAPPVSALEALEERFNVLTTANGLGLTPKEDQDFALVEVQEGAVAVDGEVVTAERLSELLGADDAERLLVLTQLSASDLRSLRRRRDREFEERLERIAELQAQRDREIAELEALRAEREARDEDPEDDGEASGRFYTKDRFSFGNSLTIEERESTNDVVVIGGSLEVDGEVVGDVVVIGGGVEVNGEIRGDLTAIGGSIDIGPDANISGEVTSVGGSIYDPHNRVRGGSVQVDLGPFEGLDELFGDGEGWRDAHRWRGPSLGWHWGGVFFSFFGLAFFTLWILLLTFLNRDYVASIAQRTEREPWKAALVGLVSEILLLPLVVMICIVLLISVIGIPLLFIAVPLGLVVLVIFLCFGYAGVATWCGRLLERRFDWRRQGPFVLVLLGILLIEGWELLGDALSGFGGPIQISAWLVFILGVLLQYLAWTTGFGSVVLLAFERRGRSLPGGRGPRMPPPPSAPPSALPFTPDGHPGDFADLQLAEDGYGAADDAADESPYGPEDTWVDPFDEPSTASDAADEVSEDAVSEDAASADEVSEDDVSEEPVDDDPKKS